MRPLSSTPHANQPMKLEENTGAMSDYPLVPRAVALVAAIAGLALALLAMPSRADAEVAWEATTSWAPTVLQPGTPGRGIVEVEIGNVGDEQADGGWPTVEVALPPGIVMDASEDGGGIGWACAGAGDPQIVTCTNPVAPFIPFLWPQPHTYTGGNLFYAPVRFTVNVASDAPLGTHDVTVTVSGAGADQPITEVDAVPVGGAPLGFGLVEGSFKAGAKDAAGADYVQAGGHPDEAVVSFVPTKKFDDPGIGVPPTSGNITPVGSIKDSVVELPAGFMGNPQAVPTCRLHLVESDSCPPSTQIGIAEINNIGSLEVQMRGLYNVVPHQDAPAQFAFNSGGGGTVMLTPVVRSDGNWGVNVNTRNATEANPLFAAQVTVWGNPSDPSNDHQRCAVPSHVGDTCSGFNSAGGQVPNAEITGAHTPHSSVIPPRPLLTNPTRCDGQPDITTMHLSPWQSPARFEADGDPDLTDPLWKSYSAAAPPLTGCDALSFVPTIDVATTSGKPGAPSGLEFKLNLPQTDAVDGLATAHLRNATVTLPPGTTVNPGSADGLASCGSAQIGLVSSSPVRFTKLEPSCPLASKIGTVEVDTPLLADPLHGDVFLAAQGDHPFDSLAAIYMVIRGPGILGKLAGKVRMNSETGDITTTVIDNPQVPFETLTVRLKSGDRAPLTLPSTCGNHEIEADFSSWAGHDVEVSDGFTVDCPGTAGTFDPTFVAGTGNPIAGDSSPMRLRVTRAAGKELGRIDMSLPRGLLAGPRDVAVCTDAQLQIGAAKTGRELQTMPSCPVESQIGTTTVGVGSGVSPFFPLIPGTAATGRVFLTGTHHGSDVPAPAGMRKIAYGAAIEVPAVAGPFDLGRVVVRAAIYADPATADLRVVSDKLPRILTVRSGSAADAVDGVVVNARDVRVDVDRADFVRNPTSCREQQFVAAIQAQDGTTVSRSTRFQVGECAALAFRPRLGLRLTGRRQVRTGGHPGVRAVVRQAGLAEAGIRRAVVRLPRSLALDPDNAQGLCEFDQGTRPDLESHCPKGSIVGRARATSPLLKRPLAGNVYFVKNVRRGASGNLIRTLPMIVVALRGEIAVNLKGESSTTRDGKLVNTFANVPDAPVSRFNLNIKGGRNGILTVTRTARANINLCANPNGHVAQTVMNGHNGKRRNVGVRVKTPCAKKQRPSGRLRLKRR